MQRLSWKDFERLAGEFFAKELGKKLFHEWPVQLKNGQVHKFDFSSEDESIIVECKSHTWTKSGNYPSGKVAESQMAIRMLQESKATRKIIIFYDDVNQKKQSLVEVFVRRNKCALSGIEVWKYYNGKFESFYGLDGESEQGDKHAIDLAVKMLVDQSHRARTELIISFREIAQRLGIALKLCIGLLASSRLV